MEAYNVTNPSSLYVLTFLLALLLSISPTSSSKTYTNFIRTSCSSTTYPSVCFKTLSSYAASVQSNHLKLCNAALTVTIRATRNTLTTFSNLALQKGITRFEAAAIRDCVDNLGDSIDELKQSLKEMGRLGSAADKEFLISNVKTWVSAAITDEDTCTDGFAGRKVNPILKKKIRIATLNVVKLTSNALSLINNLNY